MVDYTEAIPKCCGRNNERAKRFASLLGHFGVQANLTRYGSMNPSGDYLGPALDTDGVTVGGSIFFRHGFSANGLVKLLGARIGLNLDCTGGHFNNAPLQGLSGTGESLGADLANVEGGVLLSDGFSATGMVRFISSRIGGNLRCTDATFQSGLVVERTTINGTLYWRDIAIRETTLLDLMNTTVGSLSDDEASWPIVGRLQLFGFAYGRISVSSPRQIDARLNWLARSNRFSTQPYQHLAKILRTEGSQLGAQKVLFVMEDRRRELEDEGWLARVWSAFLKLTVGYGYNPSRPALWWLAALTIFGFAQFWAGYSAGNMGRPRKKPIPHLSVTANHLPIMEASTHRSILSRTLSRLLS
jgi:hypothetical protein